jgi:rubredoxin
MNNIPPGTAFEDLPESWVCPMCYATPDMFDPLD